MKLKIGITGGIGSGKSIVSKIIKTFGYAVLDADSIAKEIMNSDDSVQEMIKREFGDESYLNSKLNSSFLSSSVFNSVENIKKINSIVHPPVISKIEELIQTELKIKNLVFVEAALIFESEMDDILDHVLLVTAREHLRIKRIMERDSSAEDEIRKRMQFQMPEDEKEKLSDFTIHNDLTLEELEKRTKFFLQIFEFMSNSDNKKS